MKRLISLLLLLLGILVFSSCSSIDWTDNNQYNDATLMTSTYTESNNKLTITIANDNGYLTSVSKDRIIFKARGNSESSSEVKELTQEELKKDAISDYELEVSKNNDSITISLANYENTIYMVVFNKSLTKDKKYAYAYVSLLKEEYGDQPYILGKEDLYINGDENPIFVIEYYNIEIDDKTKISFDGAFSDLSLMQIDISENLITVLTDGIIGEEKLGVITLDVGFFKGIDFALDIYFGVKLVAYHLDNTSLKLENGLFSFNVLFSNKEFAEITSHNVSIGEWPISSVEVVGEDKDTIKISIPFTEGDLTDAIKALNGEIIVIDEDPSNPEQSRVFFDVNYPIYEVYPELNGKILTLHFRYHDAKVGDITKDIVDILSEDIIFEGENKNAKYVGFEVLPNGFNLLVETDTKLDYISGVLRINDHSLFKTVWGDSYIKPMLGFDVDQEEVINLTADSGTYDESFSEKVITAKPTVDDVAHVLQFAGYAAQLGFAIAKKDPYQAIGSVMNLMQLFGLTGHSTEPTIQDVLDKLNDISDQIKTIDRKIDALKQQMLDGQVATQLGLDKILFNQYRSTWDDFYENYIEKIEDILSNYTIDMRTYYVDFVKSTDNITLELKYFKHGENVLLCMENPKDLGYSIEGYPYVSSKTVTLNKDHFAAAAQLARSAQGYSEQFDGVFRGCLKEALKEAYPDLSDQDFELLFDDVYGHIAGLAQFKAVNEDVAKNMRNLFINFAKQLSGAATGTSKLVYYYKMLESYYNFQREAKTEMLQVRVNMKKLLDKYAGFATVFAQFCPGIDKSEITSAYDAAYNYIKNNDNMKDTSGAFDYCYTIGSNIACKTVRCSFDKGFNNAGSNKCTFYYNYRVYEQATSKTIDIVNNSKLLSATNLSAINARALNALKESGQSTSGFNLYSYLKNIGLVTSSDSTYGPGAITSYNGINDLSSSSFKVICTSIGVGDYFTYGDTYTYRGYKESNCWSGREASGSIYNLETGGTYADHIDRMARYDESHWYWSTDEHWGFEEFIIGRICIAIYRA